MKAVVTGSSGLVGNALVPFLQGRGWTVQSLSRPDSWNVDAGHVDASAIEGSDVLVHLAGENVAAGRWTAARKTRIRSSRVEGTALIARAAAGLKKRPEALVCASAIGFYGDRGDEELDEGSPAGTGFLADTCRAWEEAGRIAEEAGIRVVHLRIGMVLSRDGGALARMLPLFRRGRGGRLGNGRQHVSWITLDDLIRIIGFAMEDRSLAGPVNAVSPSPVTNREFTRRLGGVLRRPAIIPAPAFALRLFLGGMADELLLAGARVLPGKLEAAGFRYESADLESALRRLIG